MKAVVAEKSGGPEALGIRDVSIPVAKPSRVRLHVNAVGLTRSDPLTRQRCPSGVQFTRIPIQTP